MSDVTPALTPGEYPHVRAVFIAGHLDGLSVSFPAGTGWYNKLADAIPTPISATRYRTVEIGEQDVRASGGNFTQADVDMCNALAENYTIDFGEMQDWAASMRARLAALVPPAPLEGK
jgi:hypothetical protein